MKLNIKETIDGLESINKQLGFGHSAISNARKVCQMWKRFRTEYGGLIIRFPSRQKDVSDYMNEIEEEFFPHKIKQTVTIEIERKSEALLEDTIDQLRLVSGVKDVRPHDSRY